MCHRCSDQTLATMRRSVSLKHTAPFARRREGTLVSENHRSDRILSGQIFSSRCSDGAEHLHVYHAKRGAYGSPFSNVRALLSHLQRVLQLANEGRLRFSRSEQLHSSSIHNLRQLVLLCRIQSLTKSPEGWQVPPSNEWLLFLSTVNAKNDA